MLRLKHNGALREFSQIRQIVVGNHALREEFARAGGAGLPNELVEIDPIYWKTFDYCAAVVRMYATLERCVIDSVTAWIAWCLANRPEVMLRSDRARVKYELGFGEILKRAEDPRFEDIDRSQCAEGLRLFYLDAAPAGSQLVADPFFAAQPNLRFGQLVDLLQSVELADSRPWILNYAPLRKLCADEGFGVESELKQLVERRNEAAHGNTLPSDIFGINELSSRIRFLELLCEAIFELVIHRVCTSVEDEEATCLLGTVSHRWPDANAFELQSTTLEVRSGQAVILIEEERCAFTTLDSLQLEGEQRDFYLGAAGTALGVRAGRMPKVGTKVLSAAAVRGLSTLLA